ncbi:hypothetical protein EVAR_26578_1 [Eumeta japonica]|uniref:Uncharacterized protein n=1 Tax=Eumeta variegata TaxID=151549 RepID=A0A4C1W552_EUMVA|nr:hypothetical protein EVAR_26578_1 [Eumeta japonica]
MKLSPRKPAPRVASLHEYTLLIQRISCGVAAINDGQRFHFQTSLFSRASQFDGWLATVSDAPLPLHFIGGASVAHVSCIHFNWGGVSMHFICICIGSLARGSSSPFLFMGVGTGRRTYILPHARASSRRGYDPDGSSGNVDEGGREAQPELHMQPTAGGRTLGDADRIKAARIGNPLGVDLTERACRSLIRLSTHPTAAARIARVSEPRPSTSSFCPRSRCQSGAYAEPPAGARIAAHAQPQVEGASGSMVGTQRGWEEGAAQAAHAADRWWSDAGGRRPDQGGTHR